MVGCGPLGVVVRLVRAFGDAGRASKGKSSDHCETAVTPCVTGVVRSSSKHLKKMRK
jgi:hypothetical protein